MHGFSITAAPLMEGRPFTYLARTNVQRCIFASKLRRVEQKVQPWHSSVSTSAGTGDFFHRIPFFLRVPSKSMYQTLKFILLVASLLGRSGLAESEDAMEQRSFKNELSRRRAVLQTSFGDLHLAFYQKAAPKTTDLVMKLLELGLYNTNHFFRVDTGFVAQVAGVKGNILFDMNEKQREYAEKTVPLEVHADLKHDRPGLLSLARHDDPNSGGSSFSIMLGPAPHLDMKYAIFGEVTDGIETLRAMEGVETTREGIFVMPVERITIHSTYMYDVPGSGEEMKAEDALTGISTESTTTATKEKASCAADVVAALQAVRQELVKVA